MEAKSVKREKDKKDYVLRYEGRPRETVYFMERGTIDNPFIISVIPEEASKDRIHVIEGREITVPAWPSLDSLYYITESDGTKVYYKTVFSYIPEIPRWIRIVAGILLLMGTIHFYPILGPFCILTVLLAFMLFRDPEKAKRNKYEAERVKHSS